MIALTITIESKAALAALNTLTEPLQRTVKESIAQLLISAAKDNIAARSGPGGAWPSGPWTALYGGQRTWDDISRSLTFDVTEAGIAIGATHIAAGVRHLGTVGAGGTLPDILPVKKKALTIPLTEAASKASYQGKTAREAFPDAFVLTRDGRHGASSLSLGVLARKVGGKKNRKTGEKQGQQLELLYLLVRSVAIRPHPFLPIDRDGKLAPASLGTEIDQLIIDNFVGRAA